ncbi:MAG TPA: DUF2252 domain-containing protein [Marmoricola sp.]|nr:DUF2252 domain-containing protein [Marmoricola sp.]
MSVAESLSRRERRSRGRANRDRCSLDSLAQLDTDGRSPLSLLAAQEQLRLPDLLPLRAQRMGANPFAFYRGTAAIMAADLARCPSSGIRVASCGDAHVANFGFYASQQRSLAFDLNDFDESAWAPWEWDLKRLVTSVLIAGRATGRADRVAEAAGRTVITTYLNVLKEASKRSPLDRYFTHFIAQDFVQGVDQESRSVLEAAIADARKRTSKRAARKLTQVDDGGKAHFVVQPPAMAAISHEDTARIGEFLDQYLRSASVDIRFLMREYVLRDVVRRAVGVGSVGTRCYLALFEDGDGNKLILQTKEAGRSVLEEHGGFEQPIELVEEISTHGEGARVVGLQRILQAVSDPFLGHVVRNVGQHPMERDFYVRQFHDMKGSIDIETLDDGPFARYAAACGAVLARAHSQSQNLSDVVGYAGKGGKLTKAIMAWCAAYADLSHADYLEFVGSRA